MSLKNKLSLHTLIFIGILGTNLTFTSVMAMRADPVYHRVEKELADLSSCLDLFQESVGRYPSTQENLVALYQRPTQISPHLWKGPYVSSLPWTDPWDQNYQYLSPGIHHPESFDLFSLGRDGIEGTPDDINGWDSKKAWRTYYRTYPTIVEILNRYLEPQMVISVGLVLLIYLGFKFLVWLFKLFVWLFKLFKSSKKL